MNRPVWTAYRLILASAMALSACAMPAVAVEVVLGPADALAIDQPRVTFGLTDESVSPADLFGPTLYNLALLDTGANGILLGQLSYADGEDYGQPLYMGAPAQYEELGVAGTTLLDVHDVHALRILDSDLQEFLVNPAVRAFGDSSLNIGSFGAIIGMPAMTGYVVEIDMRPTLDSDFQRVAFHETTGLTANQVANLAFESATRINVDLRILAPEHTDTTLPEELRPTFEGLPVIDHVSMRHTGGADSGGATLQTNEKTFLVDTGAQTVIISQQMATDMGIDFSQTLLNGGDVVDYLQVGGIGGTVAMPQVVVDQFILPTPGGIDLVWTDLVVGVLDIDGAPFDAVFGMNMLTTGYLNSVYGGGANLISPGYSEPDYVTQLIDAGTIATFDDLFTLGVLTIDQDTYDAFVLLELLPDTTDPQVAYDAALALEQELKLDLGLDSPLFDKVVFDFTPEDETAVMRLDFRDTLEVPEPGTLVLMASAGAMVGWRRRKAA